MAQLKGKRKPPTDPGHHDSSKVGVSGYLISETPAAQQLRELRDKMITAASTPTPPRKKSKLPHGGER
jgi:hypothetical protein